MKKIWAFIITFIAVLGLFSLEARCAAYKSLLTLSGKDSEIKTIIGILILCVFTALITLKRVISAKKNNLN